MYFLSTLLRRLLGGALHPNKEVINKEGDMGCRGEINGIQKRMEKEKKKNLWKKRCASGLGNFETRLRQETGHSKSGFPKKI